MAKQIKLNFLNEKGEEKNVQFYLDDDTFLMLEKSDVPYEDKHRYLIEKYHEYERERYYRRKYELYDEETLEEINYYQKRVNGEVELFDQIQNIELKEALDELSPKQRLIIELIFYKGFSQKETADFLGVTKQAIHKSLNNIYSILRKKIN